MSQPREVLLRVGCTHLLAITFPLRLALIPA